MSTLAPTNIPQGTRATREEKRVLAATLVGTAIEWYDYFIYAQAAGLVLGALFFAPVAKDNAPLAQTLSLATIGISFLFRPLGAMVCGHIGDKVGRKATLVMTLILMGAATALIGVLPTYTQIGVWAPISLIILRILQGFSAGGEWGGAALMAVGHAPVDKRRFFGSFPQLGVPRGMILATLVLLVLTAILTKDQFTAWGWRLPFLFSVALVFTGFLIRRTIEESPVYEQMHRRRKESSAPLGELFRHHWKQVLLTALIFMGNNAAGYLLIAFFITYGDKSLHLPTSELLSVCTLAAVAWVGSTLVGGVMGDRIGRVRTFQIGYVGLALWAIPMWFLIDSRDILLFFVSAFVLTVLPGITYWTHAAVFPQMLPAEVLYCGVSVGYALGSIIGGAFSAPIAEGIFPNPNQIWLIRSYNSLLFGVSFFFLFLVNRSHGGVLDVQEMHAG